MRWRGLTLLLLMMLMLGRLLLLLLRVIRGFVQSRRTPMIGIVPIACIWIVNSVIRSKTILILLLQCSGIVIRIGATVRIALIDQEKIVGIASIAGVIIRCGFDETRRGHIAGIRRTVARRIDVVIRIERWRTRRDIARKGIDRRRFGRCLRDLLRSRIAAAAAAAVMSNDSGRGGSQQIAIGCFRQVGMMFQCIGLVIGDGRSEVRIEIIQTWIREFEFRSTFVEQFLSFVITRRDERQADGLLFFDKSHVSFPIRFARRATPTFLSSSLPHCSKRKLSSPFSGIRFFLFLVSPYVNGRWLAMTKSGLLLL